MAGTPRHRLAGDDLTISQKRLAWLAEQWEPEASSSPQTFRLARCAYCGHRIFGRLYHCWLNRKPWLKELHLHRRCYRRNEDR